MVIALILHPAKTSTRTLFPPSPFSCSLPVSLLLELLFSCCCHLFHFSNERDVAGEELSQSGDIFFEAQAQKSSLLWGNENSLLWYLIPHAQLFCLGYVAAALQVLWLRFLFHIVSVFTQTPTSMFNPSMFPSSCSVFPDLKHLVMVMAGSDTMEVLQWGPKWGDSLSQEMVCANS